MWIRISVWLGSQLLLVRLYAAQVMTSAALIETGEHELAEGQFTAAVRKWEFKPVVLNGEPQEFMTIAVLRFVP